MRRSRRFIKEHELKTIANVDKKEREEKVKGSEGKIGRNWKQVHNKEEDRKKAFFFFFLNETIHKKKAGTVSKEKGQECRKWTGMLSFHAQMNKSYPPPVPRNRAIAKATGKAGKLDERMRQRDPPRKKITLRPSLRFFLVSFPSSMGPVSLLM